VLEKGWDRIYFYKGNKIDIGTASRAMGMMRDLAREPGVHCTAGPLYGHPVSIEMTRMPAHELPRCFNRGLHERLKLRETSMLERKRQSNSFKEGWSSSGYS
jgi:hypothetical protein